MPSIFENFFTYLINFDFFKFNFFNDEMMICKNWFCYFSSWTTLNELINLFNRLLSDLGMLLRNMDQNVVSLEY